MPRVMSYILENCGHLFNDMALAHGNISSLSCSGEDLMPYKNTISCDSESYTSRINFITSSATHSVSV